MKTQLIQDIDKLLPQTQCRLCEYEGCLPYARALVEENAPLDKCLPGGLRVLESLSEVLQKNIEPLKAGMQAKSKAATVVKINEALCIGCTKCIQACPVDAIVGSGKFMHTVIEADCTGCQLCIEPCPVDCIDIVPVDEAFAKLQIDKADVFREKYKLRTQRLNSQTESKVQQEKAKIAQDHKKDYIAAAVARAKAKKQMKS